MIVNFAGTVATALWRLLWVAGALVGLMFGASALMRMVRASRLPGQSPVTVGDILPLIIIGALLINLSKFINLTWNSIGSGTVTFGAVAYSGAADFGQFAAAINAVLTLASVAGGFFFFKGLLLLKKATMEGQSSHGADDYVWRSITHMVGGAMLVQIPDVIDAFRASLQLFW